LVDLTTILNELPQLNAEQRQVLLDRLNALKSLENTGNTPKNTILGGLRKAFQERGFSQPPKTAKNDVFTPKTLESHDVLRAICDFMTYSGLETPHFEGLRRAPQYKAFNDKCAALGLFIGECNRIERQALLVVGIELLYKNLVDMGIAVSARTLMSHIHRVPAVVNRSFPLYAQNGYLKHIVRAQQRKGKLSG
jgi:hypothetical protein